MKILTKSFEGELVKVDAAIWRFLRDTGLAGVQKSTEIVDEPVSLHWMPVYADTYGKAEIQIRQGDKTLMTIIVESDE